jgi:hypothetical protein
MITIECWDAAVPVDDYVGGLWRKHRTRFTRNLERGQIPDELRARFAGRPLRLLVLTEPYCDDSTLLVPVVWRLAREMETIELRVARQHEYPDLAARYANHAGHPAIPVFILLDGHGRELGALVERPARMTADTIAEARRFQAAHPNLPGIQRAIDRMPEETQALLKQHLAAWRDERFERWAGYLLDDLAGLVERS